MNDELDQLFEARWRPDVGFFGPGSMMWQVMRNRLIGLAGSRALIMQLSLPDVAQGVAAHSIFMKWPLVRAFRTFWSLAKIIFGTKDEARHELGIVGQRHGRVRGTLTAEASRLRAGHSYSSADPRAKLWVLASFASTVQVMHDRLAERPLSPNELDALWQDWHLFGRLFRVPESILPATWAEFQRYVDDMLDGNIADPLLLEPEMPLARRLCSRLFLNVLSPPLWSGVTTWGLLPEQLRHLALVFPPFGKQRRHDFIMRLLRRLSRRGPRKVRFDPVYTRALARLGPEREGLEPDECKLADELRRAR